jgi:hypothetical protein
MLQDISVETGMTTGAIDDVPTFQAHQFIIQAREFVKRGTHPIMYYQAVAKSLPQVPGIEHKTAMYLLTTIEVALINQVADELKAANQARKDGNTKAVKPADLFRKYHASLEQIIKRGTLYPKYADPVMTTTAMQAKVVDTDLYLDQSLSNGDLLTPDYIDPYTNEQIIEANDASEVYDQATKQDRSNPLRAWAKMVLWQIEHNNTDTPVMTLMSGWQKEILQVADQCARDLGWDDATKQAFINAQMGGFDQDSDDIVLPDDTTDDYTPSTLLPNELVLNRELWWSARDAVNSFNNSRSKIFEWMKAKFIKSRDWWTTFRTYILKSPGHAELIAAIEKVSKEDVITGATIYLSMAGDYGLMEEDMQGIHGLQVNSSEQIWVNLLDFANAWEDDLLNLTQDALSPTSETSPHDHIDVIGTAEFRATMPQYDPNPVKTAAWNIGFAQAAMSGGTWKQAEDAGWQQWREEMDPKASRAYDEAFTRSERRNVAMSAFWKVCDPIVPRPKDVIRSIARNKMGLVLESGREIAWSIVELKIRKNELDLSGDIRPRLLAKLQELNIGKRVWDLLGYKLSQEEEDAIERRIEKDMAAYESDSTAK